MTAVIPTEADTEGKQYIDAVSYEKLPDDEVGKYFTFNPRNNHDMIVAGECEKEITKDYKITDLKNDVQKSGTIASLADYTEGTLLKHWKVICK